MSVLSGTLTEICGYTHFHRISQLVCRFFALAGSPQFRIRSIHFNLSYYPGGIPGHTVEVWDIFGYHASGTHGNPPANGDTW